MEIFWNTIAAYNAATWPAQIGFTLVAAMLLVLLSTSVRRPQYGSP